MRKLTKAELGWKRHRGGKCPVPLSSRVEVRCRNGLIHTYEVNKFIADPCIWSHMRWLSGSDIMAYRILE